MPPRSNSTSQYSRTSGRSLHHPSSTRHGPEQMRTMPAISIVAPTSMRFGEWGAGGGGSFGVWGGGGGGGGGGELAMLRIEAICSSFASVSRVVTSIAIGGRNV